MLCSSTMDGSFGPVVNPCRRVFDFTVFFEESFLSIVPSSVFLVAAFGHFLVLRKRQLYAQCDVLYFSKLALSILYGCLQLALLVQLGVTSNLKTRSTMAAAALSVLVALTICLLSYLEHRNSFRPSILLTGYFLLTILFDAARARTMWIADEDRAISITFSITVAIKLGMIILENTDKTVLPSKAPYSKEERAGLFGKSLFLWLNSLMTQGFRKSLLPADLRPVDPQMLHQGLSQKFRSLWSGSFSTSSDYDLAIQVAKNLKWNLLSPVIPRLCLTGFKFAQPFLVTRILNYLENTNSADPNIGGGLIGACVIVYMGIAISGSWYYHQAYRAITMIRGGLVSAIFRKTLTLHQDEGLGSRTMTLMTSDIQQIVEGLSFIHEVWGGVVEAALATWLLVGQLGLSSLSVCALAIVCTIITLLVSKRSFVAQQKWIAAMQERIKITGKMVGALKSIKMLGDETWVGNQVQAMRAREIHIALPFRNILIATVILSFVTSMLSSLVAFGSYLGVSTQSSQPLDISRMFTSLVIISLLSSPIITVVQALPIIGAAAGCFARIQQFLAEEERQDYRLMRPHLAQEQLQAPKDSYLGKNDADIIVSIQDAEFGWPSSTQSVLGRLPNLEIHRGEFVAIMGPVGCGKSLLLKALLGEAQQIHGSTYLATSSIAYCSQTPWLENISAERTIGRFSDIDSGWRELVIRACALDDVRRLSCYRSGTIGNNGSILSGGQKQRLALARAISHRRELLLLDEVLSGLDEITKNVVLTRLVGKEGLLRTLRTTVVYATHDESIARRADRVIRLDKNGSILSCELSNVATSGLQSTMHEGTEENKVVDLPMDGENNDPMDDSNQSTSSTDNSDMGKVVSDTQVYIRYFRSIGKVETAIFFLLGIFFGFTNRFTSLWVQWWSADNSTGGKHTTQYWLGIYAMLSFLPLLVLGIWIGYCVLTKQLYENWLTSPFSQMLNRIIPKSGKNLHYDLLQAVLRAPFAYLAGLDHGNLMNRFNQDMMLVDATLPIDMFNTAAGLFTSIMQLFLIVTSSVYLLGVLPVLVLALYFIQRFYLRTSKQLRLLDLEAKAPLHSHFLETCSGLLTIRSFSWEEKVLEEHVSLLNASQEPFYLLYSVQRWLQLVLNLLTMGIITVVAGAAVGLQTSVNVGAIGVAFSNISTLSGTLTNFIISWTAMETSLGAVARTASFCDSAPKEQSNSSSVDSSNSPGEWPSDADGCIELHNIRAKYTNSSPTWTLRDITVSIPSGAKVAICGSTGSGKSSLLLSLLSMIEVAQGRILVGGSDLSQFPGSIIREHLVVVPQDGFILGATLRDGLDPSGENQSTSDADIEDVLRKCNMWSRVESIGGLNAPLNTDNFSAGEGQLFYLARAILKARQDKSKVVLMDEATSSLDAETDSKVHKLVQTEFSTLTVLSVLHRLETAVQYDHILVLDKGEVKAWGSPDEVIAQCDLFEKFR